jgi:hypothetical protein
LRGPPRVLLCQSIDSSLFFNLVVLSFHCPVSWGFCI